MDNKILKATIKVFQECDIHSFPIDCIQTIKHYGYRVYTYKELRQKNPVLYEMCIEYSEDAFREGTTRIIAYNDEKPIGRIRFSLMHELGHHVLRHSGNYKANEREANTFASYILAPRMAIHYARCKNANDVAHCFLMSHEASENAFDDYRKWYRNVVIYKMSLYDKTMYAHFYNADRKCFVWNIQNCTFCGRKLFNSPDNHCKICTLPPFHTSHSFFMLEDDEQRLRNAHNKWLYDF